MATWQLMVTVFVTSSAVASVVGREITTRLTSISSLSHSTEFFYVELWPRNWGHNSALDDKVVTPVDLILTKKDKPSE